MTEQFQKILCVDFDGVIHKYSRGWQGGEIYDPPTEGFFEWLETVHEEFHVVVYSSRSKDPKMVEKMFVWMIDHCKRWLEANRKGPDHPFRKNIPLEFAHEKPPAWLTIDDRAICFKGNWLDEALDAKAIREFKPWTTK